ncbi:MAG: hypothetical protein ABFD08_17965 [Syntrophomonas sp.]
MTYVRNKFTIEVGICPERLLQSSEPFATPQETAVLQAHAELHLLQASWYSSYWLDIA